MGYTAGKMGYTAGKMGYTAGKNKSDNGIQKWKWDTQLESKYLTVEYILLLTFI